MSTPGGYRGCGRTASNQWPVVHQVVPISTSMLIALSSRQRRSLALAMAGHSNREIARLLGATPAQVRSDLFAAARKMGANSRGDMILAARRIDLKDGCPETPDRRVIFPGEPDARANC